METLRFVVPSLTSTNTNADLGSVLLGLSGIEHIALDDATHVLSVDYDPAFADRDTISDIITKSGYPCQVPPS